LCREFRSGPAKLVVGVDADIGGDLHRLAAIVSASFRNRSARARGRERIIAARADRGDHAALGLQHVAIAGDDQRQVLVGDDQHRLQIAEIFVGAPVLGELDRGAQQLAVMALELGFQPLEQSESVKASAVAPANLTRRSHDRPCGRKGWWFRGGAPCAHCFIDGLAGSPATRQPADSGTRPGRRRRAARNGARAPPCRALLLAARKTRRLRGDIVGVDLNRQPFGGEEEFDHDRRVGARGMREPYFAHAALPEIAERARDIGSAPGLFDDDGFKAGQHRSLM
jgi:hypothetical protein